MESGIAAVGSRDEFMQLLVTQLRNQDPLEPIKQQDFLAQLAQFSTLEGIENLNSTLESQVESQQDAWRTQQFSQMASLLGREVAYSVPADPANPDALPTKESGIVSSVTLTAGNVQLQIAGGPEIPFDRVERVRLPQAVVDDPDRASQDGELAGDELAVTAP